MEERSKEREIALELYDSMSNHLAGIKMRLEAKLEEMGKRVPPSRISLEDILANVREALKDLHELGKKLDIT